ncbi:MAG TPA: Eco57I restriction-modification methylase domain-containing protein [Kofleriaceae bacterium]|nr:Eco57I restriction-modification methylase domain-containing protein [Kofleriaceae bacterium]
MAVTRAPGVVYTPREVCEPMVRRALAPLVAGKTAAELLALRVCDPAIGEGAFLVEIVRVIAEALGGRDARRRVAERCIAGADIDPRAVAAARRALEQLADAPLPALAERLRVGDALALDWPVVDAVVGNPPYIRQERLAACKQALRRFASYDGVADLYVYFVELAHRMLRPGGRYCLIVPNKWLTAAYGGPLRRFLARERSLEGVVDFARALPLFGDADAFPCIVWGTAGGSAAPIAAHRVAEPIAVAAALDRPGAPHARDAWRDGPWHVDAPGDAGLLARLAREFAPLGEVVTAPPSRGVVTGCNRAFVIDGATRARLVDAEPAAAALIRPFVKGRDLRRWRPAQSDRFILLVDRGTSLAGLPRVRAHLARFRAALEPRPRDHAGAWPGRKPGAYRWYELQDPVVPLAVARAPRLLYQDIQTAPACALDPGELVPDTTVWILPTGDPFVLAVLNSPLYLWYARRRFPPALNGAVRPKLAYLRALPLAEPAVDLHAQIAVRVAAQLDAPDPARDRELAALVGDAYRLSRRERALIDQDVGSAITKRSPRPPQRRVPRSRSIR